jgi:hypothetical protein
LTGSSRLSPADRIVPETLDGGEGATSWAVGTTPLAGVQRLDHGK